jgi:hypothetical protein
MSEKSLTLRLALFAAIAAISAAPLFGKAFYGSVVTLTNQSSAAVVDGTVKLTNVGIGDRHQGRSGAGRDYQVLNPVPGTYRVDVEQSGFKKAACELEVAVSGSTRADISAAPVDVNPKVGTVGATVEVAAYAAQIQADSSAVTDGTEAQVAHDVPNVTQSLFFLRHAAERRPAARRDVNQHFRRYINERQSASAI